MTSVSALVGALLLSLWVTPVPIGVQAQEDRPQPVVTPGPEETGSGLVKVAAKEDAKKPQTGKVPSRATKAAKPRPTPAKELFGAARTPAPLAARSIGFYAKGCLAGAAALPIDGPAWQAMRLSRNRNWGHPDLIALLERFAADAKEHDGWPGLLVGDISQPRGGPMSSGHASHQVGLDADVWFTPMPDHRLTEKEREEISATSMLAADGISVDPKVWTEDRVRLLKRAASYPQVERVLVHPAIKKAVCEATAKDKGADRAWLNKVRPYWGHYYHFHIRIACPKGSAACQHQPPVGDDDGCGAELTRWLRLVKPPPVVATPPKAGPPPPERHPITLDQLPAECRAVLATATPPLATPPALPDKADKAADKADGDKASTDNKSSTDKTDAEAAAKSAPAPSAKQAAAKAPSASPAAKPSVGAAPHTDKQTKPAPSKAVPLYD